jgi:hypothetical protein
MGLGTKIVIIMFSINMILWFYGFTSVAPLQTEILNITCDNVSNPFSNCTIPVNSTFGMGESDSSLIGSIPIFGTIFNDIGLAWDAVKVFIGLLYAPVVTLNSFGAPIFMTMMIGVLWTIMYIIALMSFLRGVEF